MYCQERFVCKNRSSIIGLPQDMNSRPSIRQSSNFVANLSMLSKTFIYLLGNDSLPETSENKGSCIFKITNKSKSSTKYKTIALMTLFHKNFKTNQEFHEPMKC